MIYLSTTSNIGHTDELASGVTAVGIWYPAVIGGFLSLVTIAAVLAFLVKKL